MGVIDSIKTIADVIRRIDNIELYRQILDLQAEVMSVVEENVRLKQEVGDLRGKLIVKDRLVVRDDCYWVPDASSHLDGPFCSTCWDTDQKLVRMLRMANEAFVSCTLHKRSIKLGLDES